MTSPRAQGAVLLAAASVGVAALAVRPPVAGAYPACVWRSLTGTDCPFCGGLRSVAALSHGDLAAAADYNVLVAVGVPLLLLAAVAAVLLGPRAGRSLAAVSGKPLLVAGLVVVLGFFALRSMPFAGWLTSTA